MAFAIRRLLAGPSRPIAGHQRFAGGVHAHHARWFSLAVLGFVVAGILLLSEVGSRRRREPVISRCLHGRATAP
jgi:hypothetical protein